MTPITFNQVELWYLVNRLEDDDPRPGGDGGRRERLRGGRADPTQRLRGVQPPRASFCRT
jgi:hypothetical protein